jgi:hypothetical protein
MGNQIALALDQVADGAGGVDFSVEFVELIGPHRPAGEIAIRARHPGAALHEPGRDAALHAERGTRDAT